MENKVLFIRLLSGDDIIAEVTDSSKTKMNFKNPMLILNNIELEEGRQTLILYPFIPQGICLGNTIELKVRDILLTNIIEPEIKDYYDGIVEHAFATKPKAVSSSMPKYSEMDGKNVISFNRPKVHKDI